MTKLLNRFKDEIATKKKTPFNEKHAPYHDGNTLRIGLPTVSSPTPYSQNVAPKDYVRESQKDFLGK